MCDESLSTESTFPVYEETWLLGMYSFSLKLLWGLKQCCPLNLSSSNENLGENTIASKGSKYRFCKVFHSMLQTDGEYIYNEKKKKESVTM